tara:strand:+ start:480 stop:1088 length:609 start_codon:yes stop_codon:yes gene_type:complete
MNIYEKVVQFQKEVIGSVPLTKIPEKKDYNFMINTLEEELQEFKTAYDQNDYGEMIDALIDLIYFALGHIYRMGAPFEKTFDQVHKANMRKSGGSTNRGDQDAEKPENWQAPNFSWIEKLPDLFEEATKVQIQKDHDYNSQSNLKDYFPFGLVSYIQMIYIKALRMVNIAKQKNIKNESMEDSLIDLVNYCSFMYKELKDKE